MKLLLIGAGGYVGGYLKCQVSPSVSVIQTSSRLIADAIHLDLQHPEDFDYSIVDSDTVALLTAAISAPDICAREHGRAWAINVTGTTDLINRIISRAGRIIFFSSDTVYGERYERFDERDDCNPAGEYAMMKHEVERRFAGNPGFKAIRLSYIFSREDKFTRYLVGCAQRGEEAELFHPFLRSIIHRDDVVQGALALAERWDEFSESVINFGGPEVLSRVAFAECLQATCAPDLQFKVTEPGEDFFKNRPRSIPMNSPILTKLLGRPASSLYEAARLEFPSSTLAK